MTLVISPSRMCNSGEIRTVSARCFLSLVTAVIVLAVFAGLFLGAFLQRTFPAAATQLEDADGHLVPTMVLSPDSRALLDHIGELSGRIVQLELEAQDLATRIVVAKDLGHAKENIEVTKEGPVSKVPPGKPAGGPLIDLDDGVDVLVGSPMDQPDAATPLPTLIQQLLRVQEDVDRVARSFAQIYRKTLSLDLQQMSFPDRRPVLGSLVSSGFGSRLDPIRKRLAFHSGLDFSAPKGTPIHASAGGKVIFSGYRREYGNTVEIDHGLGLATRYAHASECLVKVGEVVLPGQIIAKVGSTGRSTGPHLHFEILKNGRFVNPSSYLSRF